MKALRDFLNYEISISVNFSLKLNEMFTLFFQKDGSTRLWWYELQVSFFSVRLYINFVPKSWHS